MGPTHNPDFGEDILDKQRAITEKANDLKKSAKSAPTIKVAEEKDAEKETMELTE